MAPPELVSHIGIVVPDLDAACVEIGASLGVTWAPYATQTVRARDATGNDVEAVVTVTWSREGPPYLELVHGEEGTPWGSGGTRRLDHLGYWTDDLAADVARLELTGMAIDLVGVSPTGACPFDFAYLRGAGMRFELLDGRRRDVLNRWFAAR